MEDTRETRQFELITLPNGWLVGRFAALASMKGICHAVTTRKALDVDLLVRDRAAAAAELAGAMSLEEMAFLKQVHGNEVLAVGRGGLAGEADGLVSDAPGLGLMAVSADCPLILAADLAGRAAGVAHASWRGTVKQIAARLIASLKQHYAIDPGNIIACICPSASPRRYEVGPEVLEAAVAGIGSHAGRFFPTRDGKMYMDLWAANRDQLLLAGVRGENIHIAGICTLERNDLFPSHRIEGAAAGRFAAVIGIGRDEGETG